MNKCCIDFIVVCYSNYLDMDRLEYNYCPQCGTQIRRKHLQAEIDKTIYPD